MFGSCLAKLFVLDTVFVVDHWFDFTLDTIATLPSHLPTAFADVTLSRLPGNFSGFKQPALPFRLYFGATIDHPRDGMYSFVPCMPFADAPTGFARPQIQIPTIITDKLHMGKKLNSVDDTATVRTLWDRVRARTLEMGLHLGVSAKAPLCCQASTPG